MKSLLVMIKFLNPSILPLILTAFSMPYYRSKFENGKLQQFDLLHTQCLTATTAGSIRRNRVLRGFQFQDLLYFDGLACRRNSVTCLFGITISDLDDAIVVAYFLIDE